MATIELEGVYRVTSKGRTYYYAWRGKGAPRLKSKPGTPAFIDELQRAQASRQRIDPTTVKGLTLKFRTSEAWAKLSPKTKSEWTRWLDRIAQHFGDTHLSTLCREHADPKLTGRAAIGAFLKKYESRPRTRDMALQVFSRLCSYGVEEFLLSKNPCLGFRRIYQVNRSERIWTDADFAKLKVSASCELVWAANLAALTGLRRGDLLKLAWSNITGNRIEIATGKSRHRRKVVIPIGAELNALLAEIPKRAATVLTNTEGRPWASGFSASWQTAAKRAGLTDLHFHDLRGTAATRLFLAGFTVREIAETMGWAEQQVERLIDTYVKRDEIILARIAKLDENTDRTKNAKLSAKPSPKTGSAEN